MTNSRAILTGFAMVAVAIVAAPYLQAGSTAFAQSANCASRYDVSRVTFEIKQEMSSILFKQLNACTLKESATTKGEFAVSCPAVP